MRVSIKHGEKSTGMIFSKTVYTVTVKVEFSEEERAIIYQRGLGKDIILERSPPVGAKVTHVNGVGSALKVVSGLGKTVNGFHLTINKLLNGNDTYTLSTPIEAKGYENKLIEQLQLLKSYLEGNAERGENKSFEI